MKPFDLKSDEVSNLHNQLISEYRVCCETGASINMGRGLPSREQLDLSNDMLELPGKNDYESEDGTDCRNYMGQQGLIEARRLFAPVLGVPKEQVVIGGNSSLALMYDCLSFAMVNGVFGSLLPWQQEPAGISFLCPVPGYDRHFALCEAFGIRLIAVPLLDDGPDMKKVRELVADDSTIRGMWCVPKYSNPTGVIYSEKIIEEIASMATAAVDFRLFWDDAYTLHHLTEQSIEIANIYDACVRNGYPDRVFVFASTSKMALAGAGLALMGASPANIEWYLRHASVRSVGPDKINQLRHVRFLKNENGIKTLMSGHRRLLAPRFDAVLKAFDDRLGTYNFLRWSRPLGGYFISLEVVPGTAKRVVDLAKGAGVQLTKAGSCFPYGIDPLDQHLRIAPSSPAVNDLLIAAKVICICVLIAACEHATREASKPDM